MTNQKPLNKVQIDMLSQALYAEEKYQKALVYYREQVVRCRPGSGGVFSSVAWSGEWCFATPQGGFRTAKALVKKGLLAADLEEDQRSWRKSETYRFTLTNLGKKTLKEQIGRWVVHFGGLVGYLAD